MQSDASIIFKKQYHFHKITERNILVIEFLKTVDASNCIKMLKNFELLDKVGEETGEYIVVQLAIDNASAYKAVGILLTEKRKSLYNQGFDPK